MAATQRKSTAAAKKAAAGKQTPAAKKAGGGKQARTPAKDVDYSKSTNAFPMGQADKQPALAGPVDDDIDYSASTMAYPMDEVPSMRFVESHLDEDGKPVDFSKSVDRYPMYGEPEGEQLVDIDAPAAADVRFPTPGPQSSGQQDGPKGWEAQRDRMNLSTEDPTGESDTEWTPDQVEPQPGQVDGVPHTTPTGEPMTHEEEHAATGRGDVEPQAKVVKPPQKQAPAKPTTAETKTTS